MKRVTPYLLLALAGCAGDQALAPGDGVDVPLKPEFSHAPPDIIEEIDVNRFTLHLTPGWIADAYFDGYEAVYGGAVAYGNGPESVFLYNSRNATTDFAGIGILELEDSPFADHHTLSLSLESGRREQVPLDLVVVRETFGWDDGSYVLFKYTLFNPGEDAVAGLHVGQVLDVDLALERQHTASVGDDWVRYVGGDAAIVTSANPPLALGHVLLSTYTTGYRAWRNPSTPGPLPMDPVTNAEWWDFLNHYDALGPFGPTDVRHLLSHGAEDIPPGGSFAVIFGLAGGEGIDAEADALDNVDAARHRYEYQLPPQAKTPYPVVGVDVQVTPRVLNLSAPGPFTVTFTFESAEQAGLVFADAVACGGAGGIRTLKPKGRSVKVFFERADVDQRLRDGDEILCGGMLGDMTTLFAGRDDPGIVASAVPVTQLTFDETIDLAPTWSPDGRFIAFASDRGGVGNGRYAIWRMDAAVGDPSAVQVTSHNDDHWPDWSPDGSRIAFVRWNLTANVSDGIFTVAPTGGDVTQLTAGGIVERMPRYSPDGSTIAFDRVPPPEGPAPWGLHLWTMTAAGDLVGPLAWEGYNDIQPAWDPSGELVYFTRYDGADDRAIFSADPQQGEPAERVTPYEGTDNRHPAISPDGRSLAFWSGSEVGSEIILQDLRTGEHTVLVLDPPVRPAGGSSGQNLEFSPDGNSLLLVSAGNIYVADIKQVR